jgi:hypothetical protein
MPDKKNQDRAAGAIMGALPFHIVTRDNLQPPRPADPDPPHAGRFASPDALLTSNWLWIWHQRSRNPDKFGLKGGWHRHRQGNGLPHQVPLNFWFDLFFEKVHFALYEPDSQNNPCADYDGLLDLLRLHGCYHRRELQQL